MMPLNLSQTTMNVGRAIPKWVQWLFVTMAAIAFVAVFTYLTISMFINFVQLPYMPKY